MNWFLERRHLWHIWCTICSIVLVFSIVTYLLGSPKFKVGDCISATANVESWNKKDYRPFRVDKVGKKNYLVTRNEGQEFETSNLSFKDAEEYELSIDCPFNFGN
jgi:hypothetical protein